MTPKGITAVVLSLMTIITISNKVIAQKTSNNRINNCAAFEMKNINNINRNIIFEFGYMLAIAEELFGPRDSSFTLSKIVLEKIKNPYTSNPNSQKEVVIHLREGGCNKYDTAVSDLTHEVIHCLYPTHFKDINYLEEGVATYFSEFYCKKYNFSWTGLGDNDEKYKNALALVKKLFVYDKYFIRKLRRKQPQLSQVTLDDLRSINSDIDEEFARKLLKKFYE